MFLRFFYIILTKFQSFLELSVIHRYFRFCLPLMCDVVFGKVYIRHANEWTGLGF